LGLHIPTVPEVNAAAVWGYATRLLTSLQNPDHLQKYLGGPTGALGTVLPANTSLHNELLTLLGRLTAARALYLDNLNNTQLLNLPNVSLMEHEIEFPSAETLDDINTIVYTATTECPITVALPTGASRRRVLLLAVITMLNNTANAQKIDIQVQGRKGAGAWNTYFDKTDCVGFGAVDGATTSLVTLQDVTALIDTAGNYGFRCQVRNSVAQSVRYTTQYLLVVTYRMS